jgi:phage tail sheath gpL-like
MYQAQNTEYNKLIAGDYPIVREAVTIAGAAELKAGTVLASHGVAASATKAKKSVTFTGTPVASKTIKVAVDGNEVTYTTASTTLATEVAGIKSAINADNTLKNIVAATNSDGKLSIEWKAAGKAGNDMEIVVTVGDGAGVEAGDVAVEVVGEDAGDERFEIVDSGSGTAALQEPAAVLLEDATPGETKLAAFCGEFNQAELIFKDGQSINNFKVKLRKIGIFAKACI